MNQLNSTKTQKSEEIIYVYALVIFGNSGNDIEVYFTEEDALQSLYGYVAQEWDEGISEQYGAFGNLSRQEAIDAYFDCHNTPLNLEYYELHRVPLK